MAPKQDQQSMTEAGNLVICARTDRDEFYPGVLSYALQRLFDRAVARPKTTAASRAGIPADS